MERGTGRGFSLVELLVVIAIIGILATAVAVRVTQHVPEARIVRARADLATLSQAVEAWRLESGGRLPASLEELCTPLGKGSVALLRSVPKDPWKRPYLYERNGPRSFVIRTLGADGAEGGEGEDADLSSDDEDAGG